MLVIREEQRQVFELEIERAYRNELRACLLEHMPSADLIMQSYIQASDAELGEFAQPDLLPLNRQADGLDYFIRDSLAIAGQMEIEDRTEQTFFVALMVFLEHLGSQQSDLVSYVQQCLERETSSARVRTSLIRQRMAEMSNENPDIAAASGQINSVIEACP